MPHDGDHSALCVVLVSQTAPAPFVDIKIYSRAFAAAHDVASVWANVIDAKPQ
jgi:hypothetical protein